tara:strand:- start:44 stop:769 length:726 start_codon:yes stop_codon:yes gene_type:complete
MTLNLDNLYKTLLGRGPAAYDGGSIQDSARQYWTDQYNKAGGGDAGLAYVTSGIKGSKEYKDLGWDADYDHVANPLSSQHRVQARKSIAAGKGVREGWIPSYSDMFDESGQKRSDWQGTDKWYQDKMQANLAELDYWRDPELISGFENRITDLQGQVRGANIREAEWMKKYEQSQKDMQNVWNNANWGIGYDPGFGAMYGGAGGVKSASQLPGFIPRTRGTNQFSRSGGLNNLKTSSLNLA